MWNGDIAAVFIPFCRGKGMGLRQEVAGRLHRGGRCGFAAIYLNAKITLRLTLSNFVIL